MCTYTSGVDKCVHIDIYVCVCLIAYAFVYSYIVVFFVVCMSIYMHTTVPVKYWGHSNQLIPPPNCYPSVPVVCCDQYN